MNNVNGFWLLLVMIASVVLTQLLLWCSLESVYLIDLYICTPSSSAFWDGGHTLGIVFVQGQTFWVSWFFCGVFFFSFFLQCSCIFELWCLLSVAVVLTLVSLGITLLNLCLHIFSCGVAHIWLDISGGDYAMNRH